MTTALPPDLIAQLAPLLQEGLWTYWPDSNLISCNPRALSLLGLPPEPQTIPAALILAKAQSDKQEMFHSWLVAGAQGNAPQNIQLDMLIPGLGKRPFLWKGRSIAQEGIAKPVFIGVVLPAPQLEASIGSVSDLEASPIDCSMAGEYARNLPVATWVTDSSGSIHFADPLY